MRTIVVKSSLVLTADQRALLEKGIRAKSEDEKLEFSYVEDKSIVGIVLLSGDKYIDASFTGELHKLVKSYETSYLNDRKGLSVSEIPAYFKSKIDELMRYSVDVEVYGKVISSVDGILKIEGLSTCKYGELLVVGEKRNAALAMNLETDYVGAILLSNDADVEFGDLVFTTGKILEVGVGEGLLGRVINPLGEPLDDKPPAKPAAFRRIESEAPSIIDRAKVNEALYTGLLAIDAMVPIGKGQRELIMGDRQTGKTSIAVDTILNQKGKNVYCVYVAIGQKALAISKLVRVLEKYNAMEYTTVVCSTASDSASLQYIAPYTGTAVAEHFMHEGKDVLIVYDDLSKHAVAYRTISLLLRRPAGREAFPGDIFYIHSRLLERSAKLNAKLGGGSITALPIVETQAGDISAYIPTNIISITDGQIYLERELFNAGQRPAINVGLSVSRVGGAAQTAYMSKLSSKIRLNLSHYKELQIFSQFGASVDDNTKTVLNNGARIVEALKQREHRPLPALQEEIYMLAVTGGLLNDIPTELVELFLQKLAVYVIGRLTDADIKTETLNALSEEQRADAAAAAEEFLAAFKKELYEG